MVFKTLDPQKGDTLSPSRGVTRIRPFKTGLGVTFLGVECL